LNHWLFSGSRVGINPDAVEGRSIGDLLRTLSGTLTGVFGVIVGIAFVLGGLEEARTLSNRLTTTLTIIVSGIYQRNHSH